MEIYLIRHTTPKIAKGICYGQSDVQLAESFLQEAKKVLSLLPKAIDAVYSSPSMRCYRLAKCVAERKNIVTDPRLLEMNFGDWEMKAWDEIESALLNNWMKDFVNVRAPNGENFIDLNNRVNDFVTELLKQRFKKVAIVTHEGVIRCFVAMTLRMKLSEAINIRIDYSCITKLTFSDSNEGKVEYINKYSN